MGIQSPKPLLQGLAIEEVGRSGFEDLWSGVSGRVSVVAYML